MGLDIWGDEIAYDHRVIGRLTIGATTFRDQVEAALLADSEAMERDHAKEIEDLEKEHEQELGDKDIEIEDWKSQAERAEADLAAIDGGVEIAQLRAELAMAQQATREWIQRCNELLIGEPKPRKRKK